MEESLFRKLSEKYNVPNPLHQENEADTSVSTAFPSQSTTFPDYATLLSDFYKRHNPGKISEVNKTLVKYKVSFPLN